MASIINRLLDWVNNDAEWKSNQTSPHIVVNEGIAAAALLHLTLKGKGTNNPPGSPGEGEGYIVGATPTGDWSGFAENNIAYYHNGAWQEMQAIDQLRVFVNDGAGGTDIWEYDGSSWVLIVSGGAESFVGLSDTPGSYTDEAGKIPSVKSAEDGIEFKATPYDVPVVFGGTPSASEVIARFTLARDIDFGADFAGAQGTVETNPDATFNIDVQDDGTSIGTITISTAGAYTFVTTGNTAKTSVAGSKLEFIGPDPADASVAGISFMLRGTTVDL